MLIFILFTYSSLDSLCLFLLRDSNVLLGGLFCVCRFLAFLVRILIFMAHLWLPTAHVEAPVFGSMISAGGVLKLGGSIIIIYNYIQYIL